MSTLSEKLKIKPGIPLLILNAPDGYISCLSLDPKTNPIYSDPLSPGKFCFIQLFAYSSADLKIFPDLIDHIEKEGTLWLCYQKKNKKKENPLTRDKGWVVVLKEGYRPVALVSIDDEWTAIRWKQKGSVKTKSENIYPEIDLVNRMIYLPADFEKALIQNQLIHKFSRMSFTHKKEYVEAIVSAKKPETRKMRIEKTIKQIITIK